VQISLHLKGARQQAPDPADGSEAELFNPRRDNELHPADRFAVRLDQRLHAEFVRFGRGTTDAVNDWIDLEALLDGVKRGQLFGEQTIDDAPHVRIKTQVPQQHQDMSARRLYEPLVLKGIIEAVQREVLMNEQEVAAIPGCNDGVFSNGD